VVMTREPGARPAPGSQPAAGATAPTSSSRGGGNAQAGSGGSGGGIFSKGDRGEEKPAEQREGQPAGQGSGGQ